MNTEYKHTIRYLTKDTGDAVQTMDIRIDDEDDALLIFYSNIEHLDLSAYEYDIFIKATSRLTMTETVAFYNTLMCDCKIIGVDYITNRQCYPEE